jgi:hypothetical protein
VSEWPPNPLPKRRARVISALVLLGASTVLAVAVWLKPDPRGIGTHEQLRMAPCGMLISFGVPCPSCGMTTAFAHTVRGQWLRAIWAQPAGFVFALATVVAVVLSAVSLLTGRPPRMFNRHVTPFRICLATLILLLSGWAAKILLVKLQGLSL